MRSKTKQPMPAGQSSGEEVPTLTKEEWARERGWDEETQSYLDDE